MLYYGIKLTSLDIVITNQLSLVLPLEYPASAIICRLSHH